MGDPNLALYRAAIGQIMADAGITRSTIQEMVRQMIAEKVEKQFQYIAAHEFNTYSFRNKISNIFSDEIRKAVKDEVRNISITVVAGNKTPDEKSDEGVRPNDIARTIESWMSSKELNLPPDALWHLAAVLGFCAQNDRAEKTDSGIVSAICNGTETILKKVKPERVIIHPKDVADKIRLMLSTNTSDIPEEALRHLEAVIKICTQNDCPENNE